MSYLVLARKWRPQTFEQVVGQRPVVRTLQNALRLDRVAHAMLFSGVRGVGKTTLARIMAKAINCRAQEAGQRPCDQCDSCREISAGSAVDLHEIDGASNRGIQEIRELKENIRFLPVAGKHKIVIIDEVHMLTTEAFNALLKTLEEPPAHVYFMFATTELHKIPVTILSRCQRYELTRVPFAELLDFFRRVVEAEQVRMPDSALAMIAREADGSVRDGLSLLDQVFSFGGQEVGDDDVRQMLGLVDRQVFEHLARALLAADLAGVLGIFDQSYRAGMDLKRFAADLLNYFRNLVVCRATEHPEQLLDLADSDLTALREIAAGQSGETLLYCFNLLFKGIEEMQYASRPKLVLEMTLVRATQGGQVVPAAQILGRLEQLLAGLPMGDGGGAPAAPGPGPQRRDASYGAEASPVGKGGSGLAEPVPELVKAPPAATAQTETVVAAEPAAEAAPPAEPRSAPVSPPASSPKEGGRDLRRDWDGFVRYVRERKVWMAPVLEMAAGAREEGGELLVRYDDPADCKLLEEPENSRLLTEYAQDYFQQELTLRLRIRGGGSVAVDGDGLPQEERRALANDPLVQAVTEIFNGDVVGIRTGSSR
ncbi:MAG TPA: DNA polymerase III subunit gamma/tau [Desulfurivibrio alkaliphilus]|uniref:DNA polymerase III subunit gamma/tau n=1 Tax=Desulfurivibrio alkaliphilus TaxID=427923 RepID=A0A7C2TIE9_9BACT|nr:DNA polymerase III subunit gamma/tau [Desulfurivibrio alkaliphilus]